MKLAEIIETVAGLTDALRQALESGDEASSEALLARRGEALALLDEAYRQTPAGERTAQAGALEALRAGDRALQAAAGGLLARSGQQARAGMGLTVRPGGSYDQAPLQACVDSKA